MRSGRQWLWAAETWYASGTFWAILAVAVGVIAIPVTTWAAFRSANPRRTLHVVERSTLSLIRLREGAGDGIEVHRDGRVLTSPHTITVRLAARGARDIAPEAFGGRPIELDFGRPVLALLEQRSEPGRTGVSAPPVAVQGTRVVVGPALITRNHSLRYTALVEGRPTFTLTANLADVEVADTEPVPDWVPRRVRLWAVAALGWSALSASLTLWGVAEFDACGSLLFVDGVLVGMTVMLCLAMLTVGRWLLPLVNAVFGRRGK